MIDGSCAAHGMWRILKQSGGDLNRNLTARQNSVNNRVVSSKSSAPSASIRLLFAVDWPVTLSAAKGLCAGAEMLRPD